MAPLDPYMASEYIEANGEVPPEERSDVVEVAITPAE
jgi:hypothetical protein